MSTLWEVQGSSRWAAQHSKRSGEALKPSNAKSLAKGHPAHDDGKGHHEERDLRP